MIKLLLILITCLLVSMILCSCDRPPDVQPGECWFDSWHEVWRGEPVPERGE